MLVNLHVRLSQDGDTFIVTTEGNAKECIAWLSGFLVNGVIVDSMKVMG